MWKKEKKERRRARIEVMRTKNKRSRELNKLERRNEIRTVVKR